MYVGGYYDSGMGGMEETSGMFSFLNTLPPWLSAIIMVVAVILGAMLLGLIVGKILGGVIYPDPDKESVYGLKMRIVIFLIVIGTIGTTGYIIYDELNPDIVGDDMATGGEIMPEDGMGVMPEGDVGVMPEGGVAVMPMDAVEALPEDGEVLEGEVTTEGEAIEGEVAEGETAEVEAAPEANVAAEPAPQVTEQKAMPALG